MPNFIGLPYELATEWKINYDKFGVSFSLNIELEVREAIQTHLNRQKAHSYDKFLRLPSMLIWGKANQFKAMKE